MHRPVSAARIHCVSLYRPTIVARVAPFVEDACIDDQGLHNHNGNTVRPPRGDFYYWTVGLNTSANKLHISPHHRGLSNNSSGTSVRSCLKYMREKVLGRLEIRTASTLNMATSADGELSFTVLPRCKRIAILCQRAVNPSSQNHASSPILSSRIPCP